MSRKDSAEGRRKKSRVFEINFPNIDQSLRVQELQDLLTEEKKRNAQFEAKFDSIHHEMAVKSIEMEEKIIKLKYTQRKVRNGHLQAINPIKELEIVEDAHSRLQGSIKDILEEATDLVSIKEGEIVKSFDTRLAAICSELEEKRKRKTIEISVSKDKEEKYKAEAEMLKASASYIESKNKTLTEQNRQLKIELSTRESEVNAVKSRIKMLKATPDKNRTDSQSPFTRAKNPLHGQSIESRSSSSDSRSQRYENIVQKLKQLLDIERNNLRAAKTAFTAEMEYKTEIEKILRACVDDIKGEILKKKGQSKKGESEGEKKVLIDELLKAEDVLNKIYDRAYPKSLLKR